MTTKKQLFKEIKRLKKINHLLVEKINSKTSLQEIGIKKCLICGKNFKFGKNPDRYVLFAIHSEHLTEKKKDVLTQYIEDCYKGNK